MGLVPPWIGVSEAAPPKLRNVQRQGFEYGAPRNDWGFGALQSQQGERRESLVDQLQLYLTCPWVNACVNTIARTCTAGGIEMTPVKSSDDTPGDPPRPAQLDRLEALFRYVNPSEDAIQMFRRIILELLIFGDSFTEVGWVLDEPVALWALDPISMVVDCDEHGEVRGYKQITEDNREVDFAPEQVIHVSMDAPRGGVYGVSPTQLCVMSATAWLWNMASMKETARRGHPPTLHANFPANTATKEIDRWTARVATRMLGARNIGQPWTTVNAPINQLAGAKAVDMMEFSRQFRDEIISTFGMQPHAVGIVESGNLGGGTGESQTKNLRINTTIPIEGIVLEKFNYHITQVGFGITEWRLRFSDVDLRDSKTVEEIRQIRLNTGAYTPNRYRAEIGEPPIPGGDDAIILTRLGPIFWEDLARWNEATIAELEGKATQAANPTPQVTVLPNGAQPRLGPSPAQATQAAQKQKHNLQVEPDDSQPSSGPRESVAAETMRSLTTAFDKALAANYSKRRKRALAETARATADAPQDAD